MTKPILRAARKSDLVAIIELLADDELGKMREIVSDPPDNCYHEAFAAMEHDDNQKLMVIEQDGEIAGCLQLSFIPGLSRSGMWRAQIESVRVSSGNRGAGLGHLLIEWAIVRAREHGCGLVQLTTDKQRPQAFNFYRELGFVASHEGMKLSLNDGNDGGQ